MIKYRSKRQFEDKRQGEQKKIQYKGNWCYKVEDPIIGPKKRSLW